MKSIQFGYPIILKKVGCEFYLIVMRFPFSKATFLVYAYIKVSQTAMTFFRLSLHVGIDIVLTFSQKFLNLLAA